MLYDGSDCLPTSMQPSQQRVPKTYLQYCSRPTEQCCSPSMAFQLQLGPCVLSCTRCARAITAGHQARPITHSTWTRNRPVRVLPMYGLCFLVTKWHIRHRLAEAELAGARNRLGISHVAVSDVRHRRLDRHTAACQHHLRLIGRLSLYSRRPCRIRPDSVVRLKKQVNSKNGVQLLRILLLFLCPHASREI